MFRPDRGQVYHLFSRAIYTALGQENNRNRRHASPAVIARKLMVFDFVLSRPQRDWYVTEAEKVDLFSRRFNVPEHALPRRSYQSVQPEADPTVRYFVHKLPMFVDGEPGHPHFVCLVTEPSATEVFHFIQDHARLLSRLPHWTLIVIRPAHVSSDERCANQFDLAQHPTTGTSTAFDRADVQKFFETRHRLERSDLKSLSVPDIQRYREYSIRVGRRLDPLYSTWLELGGPPVSTLESLMAPGSLMTRGSLRVYRLPHRYEQFGTWAGVS